MRAGDQTRRFVTLASLIAGALVLFLLDVAASGNATAAVDPNSIVYIECKSPDGQTTSRGSGVVVSKIGMVLTAKHVAPSGYTCKGGLASAATVPTRSLIRRRTSGSFDAMLFQFVPNPGEKFMPVNFVHVRQNMAGEELAAYGFFGSTGEMVVRIGHLSTTIPDADGLLQTDVFTARAMSGGAVVLPDNDGLVGIVAGAHFDDLTGAATDYAVLSADLIATEFGLTLNADEDRRIVYFSKNADGNRVRDALKAASIDFDELDGQNAIPTNILICSADFPGKLLKRVAVLLLDAGVPIYMIHENLPVGSKRLNLESEDMTGFRPMTRSEIDSYNQCKKMDPAKDTASSLALGCPNWDRDSAGAKQTIDWVFGDRGAKHSYDRAMACPPDGDALCVRSSVDAIAYAQRHADASVRQNLSACSGKALSYLKDRYDAPR